MLTSFKSEILKVLDARPDGTRLQAAINRFIAFASEHEGVFNSDPNVVKLVKSFSESLGREGFGALPVEQMHALLIKFNQNLDICISDCAGNEGGRQEITISGQSHAIQIGDGNRQIINIDIESLHMQIDQATGTEEQKAEAKSLLSRALEHPILSAVIGGLISRQY